MKKIITILFSIIITIQACSSRKTFLEKNTQQEEAKSEKYVEEKSTYRVNRDSTSISKMDISSMSIDIIPVHKKDNDEVREIIIKDSKGNTATIPYNINSIINFNKTNKTDSTYIRKIDSLFNTYNKKVNSLYENNKKIKNINKETERKGMTFTQFLITILISAILGILTYIIIRNKLKIK